MRHVAAICAVILTGSASAQDVSEVVEFVAGEESLTLATTDIIGAQSAQDGDRWVILLDIGEPAATAFGDLTEAAVGSDVVVNLCGAEFFRVTAQGRIDGGKVILPMVSEAFARAVEDVLNGTANCDSIRN